MANRPSLAAVPPAYRGARARAGDGARRRDGGAVSAAAARRAAL